MPGHQAAAVKPKVAHACCCCDCLLREPIQTDRQGRHVRWKRRKGARLAVLKHLDGSISEHSLCGRCELSPGQLPELWERACLLYIETCPGKQILDGVAEKYVRNIPIGIVEVRVP